MAFIKPSADEVLRKANNQPIQVAAISAAHLETLTHEMATLNRGLLQLATNQRSESLAFGTQMKKLEDSMSSLSSAMLVLASKIEEMR